MAKIYSRKRFILNPKSYEFGGKRSREINGNNKEEILDDRKGLLEKRIIQLIIIIIIITLIYRLLLRYISPVFETLCEEKVKSIATIISNQESTKIMNKYQYEELYTIEKDEAGNIVIIKSNVVPINNMISDLTEEIQNRFNELESTTINIPIGNLFGTYFFSGVGPNIPARVSVSGTLDTEVKSEFIAQGINQTLHRVYVNFECNVKILTPIKNYEKQITNQVIIAEHVIVGNIPDTYYNFEGMNDSNDLLNVIE